MPTYTLIENGATITPSKVTASGSAAWEEIISPGNYPKMKLTIKGGLSIVRAFKVPASEIDAFGNEVSSSAFITEGQHPVFTNAFITEVDFEPLAGDNACPMQQNSLGIVEPVIYMCVVSYETRTLNVTSGQNSGNSNGADLYEGNVSITSEVLLIEGNGYTWFGASQRIGTSMQVAKTIPIIDRELRIPKVFSIP